MYFLLRKRDIFTPQPGWPLFFAKLTLAVLVMGALAWYARGLFAWTGPGVHGLLRASKLGAIVSVCVAVYFGVLFALGFRLGDFRRAAR
ncbi:hypothetical protein LP419_07430 [Massilia sp. H-1]|nr:hypothetical protein LP419_07430 [Massilia sp. H-1]